jgi:dienelactone hydrolase
MKSFIAFLLSIQLSFFGLSQTSKPSATIVSKPMIDSAAIADWADLLWSEPIISNDGKYFMYLIGNLPHRRRTMVVQATHGSWKREFVGAERGIFTANSKLAVFKSSDSIYFLTLGSNKIDFITGIASFKIPFNVHTQEPTEVKKMAYLSKNKSLNLLDLLTSKQLSFDNVNDYTFSESGNSILLKRRQPANGGESMELVETTTGKIKVVWSSEWYEGKKLGLTSYNLDKEGKQLVFVIEDKSNESAPINSIWYFKEGMDRAVEKINNQTPGIDSGMMVSSSTPEIGKNGKYIFFKVKRASQPLPALDPNAVQVDVWNYKDMLLQNLQLYNLKRSGAYGVNLKQQLAVVFSIESDRAIQLERSGFKTALYGDLGNDYVVVSEQKYIGDKLWLDEPVNYYIVSLKDGKKTLFNSGQSGSFSISADGKNLVYYDFKNQRFASYNLLMRQNVNISAHINESITLQKDKDEKYPLRYREIGIGSWLSNTKVLIYDNYDIWQVDITGKEIPSNLTKGFGKAHHIKFRLLDEKKIGGGGFYSPNEPLLLTAFNEQTKENGFFRVYPNKAQNPERLSMQPYLFYTTSFQTQNGLLVLKPVKAKAADIWIVKRQSAIEAPNFYMTRDFKTFKRLTNIQPQRKYNWLTNQLISWKDFEGDSSQGILYKPENFDSTKKYPVIVNYYEKHSDDLNQFSQPHYIQSDLNVPWFVSRGYLVFVPDINYTIAKAGESVVNSVVSGVKYLSQFPFVDSSKIGIQGHSFGGYETNYLVTHTNCFAAAVEGAGATNLISNYGTLPIDGSINGGQQILFFEKGGQFRLEASPWEDQKAFIDNSPIFNVDRITTPLLMMHNKMDQLVPWSQGVEFFIALRRLDKPVWMLQYDEGGHGLEIEKDKIDYTIRMTQFFDHFLKGKPSPEWMTKGIPACRKGIDPGYKSDGNEIKTGQ